MSLFDTLGKLAGKALANKTIKAAALSLALKLAITGISKVEDKAKVPVEITDMAKELVIEQIAKRAVLPSLLK